jgi:hypothetical protein
LWRVGGYTPLIRWVLRRMNGFITVSYMRTLNYNYIQQYHRYSWFTQFTDHRCSRTRISLTPLVVSQQRLSTQLYQFHTSSIAHKSSLDRSTINKSWNWTITVTSFTPPHLELNWTELLLRTPIKPWIWHTGKRSHYCVVANAWRHCWRGHVTLPYYCVIQVFIAIAWQEETCLLQRCVATVATRLSRHRRHCFLLLLRNRGSVFRCYNSYMA